MASDHPLASATGARVLARGGNAVDAGVTTLLALGVLNPFASGLGGGGLCLYRDAASGQVDALDFREVAPGKARRDMYLVKGKADPKLSREGGLAVGVPGEPAGLHALHARHGKLTWREVVQPAWLLAERGSHVGELLPKRLNQRADAIKKRPALAQAFSRDGQWVSAFSWLRRPDLARALATLRDEGPAPFYTGEIARAIVSAAQAEGGVLSADDLAKYKVTWRQSLRGEYRGHTLYTMPLPSSGGLVILSALKILEGFDLASMGFGAASAHLIIEAMKFAFADRAAWMGDGDFVKVPTERLLSQARADARRARIDPSKTFPPEHYGTGVQTRDDAGTTHISVVDAAQNMLACTSTVNTIFGSMVYVPKFGLVLNNQMDDFSVEPGAANAFGLVGSAPNAVAANKRPLSSMSPTLVLSPEGAPYMIAGASGGPTIISGTLMALLRAIDFKQSPTDVVLGTRLHHQWQPNRLFLEEGDEALAAALGKLGHDIRSGSSYNSVQILVRSATGMWHAVSDPRKSGRPAAP